MTKSTTLSTGPIKGAEVITVELIQPDSMPAVVRIVWDYAAEKAEFGAVRRARWFNL